MAKHSEGNLAVPWYFRKSFLQVVFSASVFFLRCGNFLLSYGWGFLSKNSSKMQCYNGYFLVNRDAPWRCTATDCVVTHHHSELTYICRYIQT